MKKKYKPLHVDKVYYSEKENIEKNNGIPKVIREIQIGRAHV